MDYVIREAIIQYGETKKRKRYKLFKNTNLRELKDALTIQLGIQEEATSRGMGKIDIKLARIEKDTISGKPKNFMFTTEDSFGLELPELLKEESLLNDKFYVHFSFYSKWNMFPIILRFVNEYDVVFYDSNVCTLFISIRSEKGAGVAKV